jgi:anaerobic magnesium-protoporphyrin IX monomethyl ester cyclase
MATLTLIDSLGWQDGLFNLGLAYLSSALRLTGHQVRVIDLNNKFRTTEEVVEIIGRQKPDYVGFSVKSATFANAVEIHKRLAERYPQITFIYGGPHITLSGTQILDETPAAFFIRGDAELSLPLFVKLHQSGESDLRSIDGIMYRDNGGHPVEVPTKFHTKIDDLPLPDFTTFDTFADFNTYPLLTSRGCPYKCTYCSVPAISGSRWVYRSAASVIKELDYAVNFLKMKSVVIVDDNFTLHKKRAESICDAIMESGYKFLWSCGNGIRADRIWPDLAQKMHAAGCVEVAFGIESLDDGVFAQLTKGEEIKHIRHGIRVVQEAGINVTGFFMIGLPGSTYRKDLRTLALARKLKLNNYYFGLTVPYPGTELWNWAQKNARFLVPWQNSYHISEVFREGLQRIKVEPVFDTPEYPAEQRKKMFRTVQESKTRLQDRSLKVIQNSLRATPGRPLILVRSSRRDNIFTLFKDMRPGNPHFIVYKGSSDFLANLDPLVRASYETVKAEGPGLLNATDGISLREGPLGGGVVVFDVPNGNLSRNQNLVEFARALEPHQIVALVGDRFEILPVREREYEESTRSLRLEDPEMEPAYLGIDPASLLTSTSIEGSLPIIP